MNDISIGVQLYSVRNEFAADPAGTLRAIKEMGYDGVEFAGMPPLSGKDLRAMLDDNGLKCCGWHTPYAYVQADRIETTIELNREVGNSYLIIPGGLPDDKTASRGGWLEIAGFFSGLADKLAPHNILAGYHNHHTEFAELDGEAPWDTLFLNAEKMIVAQLDLGNALYGGADPLELLERYADQIVTVHLKPYRVPDGQPSEDGFRPIIGEDSIDWRRVFDICQKGATKWYIVEYESDAFPPLEAVARNLANLRAMM